MRTSKRIGVFLLLTQMLPALAFCKALLRGTVRDSEGTGIPGAYILVHWDPSGSTVGLLSNVGIKEDIIVKADRNGGFSVELPPGFYDVFFSQMAFTPACRKLRIKKEEVLVYNPKLEVDSLVTKELGDRIEPVRK